MFTVEQILAAHATVKSGADFPRYIKALSALGVTSYEAFVSDGHTDFRGRDNYQVSTPVKYDALSIAPQSDAERFKKDLKAHQQGHTDYLTFCRDCAASGIEKWAVSMEQFNCSYYDRAGNLVLVEQIPQ
jgi:uncharacterized protein YbcV (DUF1398 family)